MSLRSSSISKPPSPSQRGRRGNSCSAKDSEEGKNSRQNKSKVGTGDAEGKK